MIKMKTRSDHKKKSLLIKDFLYYNGIPFVIKKELMGSKTYIYYELRETEYWELYRFLRENLENFERYWYYPEFKHVSHEKIGEYKLL